MPPSDPWRITLETYSTGALGPGADPVVVRRPGRSDRLGDAQVGDHEVHLGDVVDPGADGVHELVAQRAELLADPVEGVGALEASDAHGAALLAVDHHA